MSVFKTTSEIMENIWDSFDQIDDYPIKHEWLEVRDPSFDDIKIWEQIYHQPGNVGIYAAWSPSVEVYIIVYSLLRFVETYTGVDAGKQVYFHARKLGIILPINKVWVPPGDPLLTAEQLTPLQ
jgi:hypothetical protein